MLVFLEMNSIGLRPDFEQPIYSKYLCMMENMQTVEKYVKLTFAGII